jgi:hypothetical protein
VAQLAQIHIPKPHYEYPQNALDVVRRQAETDDSTPATGLIIRWERKESEQAHPPLGMLSGKVAVITGANRNIFLEEARP